MCVHIKQWTTYTTQRYTEPNNRIIHISMVETRLIRYYSIHETFIIAYWICERVLYYSQAKFIASVLVWCINCLVYNFAWIDASYYAEFSSFRKKKLFCFIQLNNYMKYFRFNGICGVLHHSTKLKKNVFRRIY